MASKALLLVVGIVALLASLIFSDAKTRDNVDVSDQDQQRPLANENQHPDRISAAITTGPNDKKYIEGAGPGGYGYGGYPGGFGYGGYPAGGVYGLPSSPFYGGLPYGRGGGIYGGYGPVGGIYGGRPVGLPLNGFGLGNQCVDGCCEQAPNGGCLRCCGFRAARFVNKPGRS